MSIRGLFRATDRTPAVTTFDPRPPVGAIRNRMAIVAAPEPQFGSEWRLPGTQQIEAEI